MAIKQLQLRFIFFCLRSLLTLPRMGSSFKARMSCECLNCVATFFIFANTALHWWIHWSVVKFRHKRDKTSCFVVNCIFMGDSAKRVTLSPSILLYIKCENSSNDANYILLLYKSPYIWIIVEIADIYNPNPNLLPVPTAKRYSLPQPFSKPFFFLLNVTPYYIYTFKTKVLQKICILVKIHIFLLSPG